MADDLWRLDADSDVCLAFLIAHQDEWGPTRTIVSTTGHKYSVPTTLVAVERPRSAWER